MCSEAARWIFSAALWIGLIVAEVRDAPACTVFCHSYDDAVLAGRSFDVPDNCDLAMVFVPAGGNTHGRVRSGRSSGPCADGMNDAGLFVAVADVPTPWKSASYKPPMDLNTFIDGLLANCATVDEAFSWCKKQRTPRLGGTLKTTTVGNPKHPIFVRYSYVTLQHILIADRMGNSMVCEWIRGHFRAVRKTGRYQLMTNFLLSAPELGNYPCSRFAADTAILEASEKPSLLTCVTVLKATAVNSTKYSLACDLVRGDIHVFLRRDFEHPRTVHLADELQKGQHQVELDQWFATPRPEPLSVP